MSEFQAIYRAHAIERCAITLAFSSEVPDKALARLVADVTPILNGVGLRRGQQPLGFQVDALSGKVMPLREAGPANFVSSDSRQQLSLLPNGISWTTQHYVRWEHFITQFQRFSLHALERYDALVSLVSVQLEYWDRFLWTGSWSDFDAFTLLNPTPYLIAPKSLKFEREWHNHIGWFEYGADARRLWNVNVDIVGVAGPTGDAVPSVGIYTMGREQILESGQNMLELPSVTPRLNALHLDLKKILREIISKDMSSRIGLDSGG